MRWPMGHASKPYVHSLVLGLIIIINATINITCILADTPAPAEGEQSATATTSSGNNDHTPAVVRSGNKKFSDPCESTEECGFADSVCDTSKKICLCVPEAPITNHIDKCGKAAAINESCFFNEQCEATMVKTECKDNRCVCRFELTPNFKSDGTVDCIAIQNPTAPVQYVDPAMIGVLVGMALMFIIICVVLRLFSNARWRENRTIFNTPNPRLMNVSLLRESKLLHQDRRNSRGSVRGPSRQPSMASLRPHSPNSQGLRRGSKGSSNASATSLHSNKSPPRNAPVCSASGATTPMLESVTVEVNNSGVYDSRPFQQVSSIGHNSHARNAQII